MSIHRLQADQIQKNATAFLKKHKIQEILEKYGKVIFFGSYSLNLMNRNDIDLVLVVDKININIVNSLIEILNPKGFNRHWIFDNTDGGCSSDPRHIVYETVYGFYNEKVRVEDRWELGIVIANSDMLSDVLKLTEKVSKLSDEKKAIILDLKFKLAQESGVHRYTGSQVYNAVLEGVKTTSEFMNYLKRNDRK